MDGWMTGVALVMAFVPDWTLLDLAARDKKTSESVHLLKGMWVSVRSIDGSSNNMEMNQMHADEET